MKIYNTKTQADYNALMIELEEKGYKWLSGDKPTSEDYWSEDKEDTCITISGKDITFDSIEWHKKEYPDIQIIEYKSKGENMLNTECKQCHKKWHHDNAKYCSMCGKKLVEEPEFKVGDYVIEQNGIIISKIGEVLNGDFWGSYYKKINNYFSNLGGNILVKDIERHATPEEIAEYESALTFHKHGRKPFEVKRSDIVYLKGYDKNIFLDSGNIYKKHNFIDGDVVLVKTAEEVNEWLGADDE